MPAAANATLRVVFWLMLGLMGSFNVYRGTFSVFGTRELLLDPAQYGLVEGLRELPGLLTFGLMAAVAGLSDRYRALLGFLALGLGLALHAGIRGYGGLIAATLIFSSGFHLLNPLLESLLLRNCEQGQRALRLGQMNSYAALGSLGSLIAVFSLSGFVSIRWFFIGAGAFATLAGVYALMLPRTGAGPHRSGGVGPHGSGAAPAAGHRVVFRRQYASFYWLTFFSGARRQIVLTFGALALVSLYRANVATMAALLGVSHLALYLLRPHMGRLIDRLGEQRVLSWNYVAVSALFMCYPLAGAPWLAYVVFLLDNLLTGFDIAIISHAGKLVPPGETSATLAMGSTINHIAGITLPIAGGTIWKTLGPHATFFIGAAAVAIAALYSRQLNRVATPRAAVAD